MEQAAGEYSFYLTSDLGRSLATSNLGIIYPNSVATEVRRALNELDRMFSQRLDPLRLLSREEELIITINRTNQELQQTNQKLQQVKQQLQQAKQQLQQTNQTLQQAHENLRHSRDSSRALLSRVSSRRYKVADAVAESALRIPGLRSLVR
jgi:DNA repair exonuclease SbcCD ATPase subunit